MNNFVVARNALIASTLVMLFMLSLQPQYISRAILSMTDAVTTRFINKDISAAERSSTAHKEDTLAIKLASTTISIPMIEGYEIEENANAAVLTRDGASQFVFTVEKYDGDVKQKAVNLAQSVKAEGQFQEVTVQPVLRGNNMFYEVSSKEYGVHYALISLNSEEIVTITPTDEVESDIVNRVLTGLKFE